MPRLARPRPFLLNMATSFLCLGSAWAMPPQLTDHRLAGSQWQLRAIQSMDDAQGTTLVKPSDRYMLQFGADGVAKLVMNCNRGVARYDMLASKDGDSGQLTFTNLAATRALCPPPTHDERLARDLLHVRSYLLKDGQLFLSLEADGGIYEWVRSKPQGPTPQEKSVRPVVFAPGQSSAQIKGRIVGRAFVDHTLRAAAGQRMTVQFKGSNSANDFNLMAPGASAEAMASGESLQNKYDGILPDDGVYTLRVYLHRAAARRGESSRYEMNVSVTGAPLKPLPASSDAVLPGTNFHASATASCVPRYTEARTCLARVVRRGTDGTATVELEWDAGQRRRILFIHGEPKHSDASQPMTFTRNERGWRVTFGDDEHFDIPLELVHGG